jgi:hypothetical protein
MILSRILEAYGLIMSRRAAHKVMKRAARSDNVEMYEAARKLFIVCSDQLLLFEEGMQFRIEQSEKKD